MDIQKRIRILASDALDEAERRARLEFGPYPFKFELHITFGDADIVRFPFMGVTMIAYREAMDLRAAIAELENASAKIVRRWRSDPDCWGVPVYFKE